MKTLGLFIFAAGCSWTQFSDLADTTWVHAQESPDSGQSDYGLGLVGATTDSPGTLAILSGSPANYSTLAFDASGSTNETLTEGLGDHSINTLSTRPLFIGDGSGDVAIVDKGIDGPLVVIHGTAGQLTDSQLSSVNLADAATFVGANIVVASAGDSPAKGPPNAWLVAATVTNCGLVDGNGSAMAAAATASDGTTMWAYTRDGNVDAYKASDLTSKCDSTQTPTAIAPTASTSTALAPAANGGYLALIGSPPKLAIAVAFDSASTMTGSVSVVDLTTMMPVGAAMPEPGVRSAAFGTFGTTPTLSLGFPARTSNVGQVELHSVDTTAGAIDSTVDELLDIPQADTNLSFGRSMATLTYNGQTILVVGASNVVYAYYQTTLYANTRQ